MWWLALAIAGDLGRQSEAISQTRYARLDGDGPVTGRYRNRNGPFLAWHFPDGQIEHVEIWEGKVLAATRTYAADGSPEADVDWRSGRVVVRFQPPVEVDTSAWVPLEVAGLSLRAPPALAAAGDGRWSAPGLAVAVQPAADPFAPAFVDEVAARCACAIEARRTVWIAGKPGLHLRLERPDRTADLVAVPLPGGLLVLSGSGGRPSELAPVRAMIATAREATPP